MIKFVFVDGTEETVPISLEDTIKAFSKPELHTIAFIDINGKFYNQANLLYFCECDDWEVEEDDRT